MWKTVLFDLDGTLTDSAEGITKSVQHALIQLGHEAPELEELNCFVGPPLKEMFMEYAGLSEEDGERAVAFYRERYVPTGMFENHLYPRIVRMLDLFEKEGITMAVASSKPETFVKQILEHFGIDDYFKVIVGSELGGARVHKKDVVEEALKRLKMEHHRDQVVLVGDTRYDIEGAREAGIECIAVTYGYGTLEEIEAAEPIYIAESVSDVAECVLSQHKKKAEKAETVGYKLWRIVYPALLHLGLSSLVGDGYMLILLLMQFLNHGIVDVQAAYEKLLENNNILTAIACLTLLPIALWFFRKDEWKRKDQGLRNRLMTASRFGPKQMILVSVFFVLYSALLNQLIAWSGLHTLFSAYQEIAESLFENKLVILTYVLVVVFAPFSEELIYRGLIYRRIRDYLGVKSAVVISALIFGIIHGNVVQFLFAFMMGLALAAVYERYRTIWAPIAAHMAVNLFSCIGEFITFNIIPESDLMAILVFALEGFVVLILGLLTLKKWKPKNKASEASEEITE